jgi:hypothetical protein
VQTVSWVDGDLNDEAPEGLSNRIAALEQTINTQLSEMRTEVGLAAATLRGGEGAAAPLADLEAQLARAVTVSLSAALEAIRESLTEVIGKAVADLAARLEVVIGSQPHTVVRAQGEPVDLTDTVNEAVAQLGFKLEAAIASQPPPILRPQWNPEKVTDVVAETVAKSVTQLGTKLESAIASQPPPVVQPPLTAEELAGVITDAVAKSVTQLGTKLESTIAAQHQPLPVPPAQWSASDLDDVATSLQHAVLQALNSFEQSTLAPSRLETIDAPATVRDVARVNQRIDELRSLLLG